MKKILKNPVTILLSIAIGVVLGTFNGRISLALGLSDLAGKLSIIGEMYLFFIQMTVIPIIITAIASSLAKLIRDKSAAGSLGKMVVVFFACIVIVAGTGMVFGIFAQPGLGLNDDTKTLLGNMINSPENQKAGETLEISLSGALAVPKSSESGILDFLKDLIPSNIFSSLTLGRTLAIVFFSIIFGIALGCIRGESANMLIGLLVALFEAFQKLISWSLYGLPFGLICLLAGQISRVGPEIFAAMTKFIMIFYAGGAVLFFAATIVIWIRSGVKNPFRVLAALFDPIIISFATRNSMAALPAAINSLENKLKFDSNTVNLTLPLGMTIGRFGNIFFFAVASFFVIQIYGTTLLPAQYYVVFLGIIFAGTATAGASGIVTLSVISIVLNPLGLPIEAILVIFMAIDPIIDPMRTFLIVYVNMMATAVIAGPQKTNHTSERDVLFERRTPLHNRYDDNIVFDPSSLPPLVEDTVPAVPENASQSALLKVVLPTKDISPFIFRGNNGETIGVEIDLIKQIAARLGREVVFERNASSDSEIFESIASGQVELGAGRLFRTDETPRGVKFSPPYGSIQEGQGKKYLVLAFSSSFRDFQLVETALRELTSSHFVNASLAKFAKGKN